MCSIQCKPKRRLYKVVRFDDEIAAEARSLSAAKRPIEMQEAANNVEGSGPDLHAEGSVLATTLASLPSIDYSDSGSLHNETVLLHYIDW
jgi:hypothetical protein